jgi:hypothetical protein
VIVHDIETPSTDEITLDISGSGQPRLRAPFRRCGGKFLLNCRPRRSPSWMISFSLTSAAAAANAVSIRYRLPPFVRRFKQIRGPGRNNVEYRQIRECPVVCQCCFCTDVSVSKERCVSGLPGEVESESRHVAPQPDRVSARPDGSMSRVTTGVRSLSTERFTAASTSGTSCHSSSKSGIPVSRQPQYQFHALQPCK